MGFMYFRESGLACLFHIWSKYSVAEIARVIVSNAGYVSAVKLTSFSCIIMYTYPIHVTEMCVRLVRVLV